MKILDWALAVLFFLFAVLQYNDPDPLQWMLLYGGMSILFLLMAIDRPQRSVAWVWMGSAVLWAVWLLPGVREWVSLGMPSLAGAMKAETPYVEETREFFGLLLAALAAGSILWRTRPGRQ